MESVMIAAGALLGLGSLSGLSAAVRVGSLERRLEALERTKRTRTVSLIAPRAEPAPKPVESVRAELVHPEPAVASTNAEAARFEPAEATPPLDALHREPVRAELGEEEEPATLEDRWKVFELRVGTRWTSWLGAAALVIAAALLVKLAVEEDWLGPAARFALGTAGAVGLLAAGWRAHRSDMGVLSHGLLGAGLGVLYISLYIASASHSLFPSELAFAAMVAVTIGGCVLALALDAQALATLAWLGGLATPVLVPSVIGSRDLACTYVLVLGIAGSTCAAVRQWQSLALAGFAGSSLVLGTWLVHRHDAATWHVELAWLAAFHIAQQIPVVILAWRRSIPGLWRGLAFVNAAIALGCAATIVDGRHHVLGASALALAVVHVVMSALVRRRADDETSHLLYPAIAVAMTTVALPLLVPRGTVTLAWSLEAVALVALVRKPSDAKLRQLALAVLALGAVHAMTTTHGSRMWIDQLSIAIVPFAAWTFAAIHRRHEAERAVTLLSALGGLAFLLAAVSVQLFRHCATSTASAAVPAVWAAGSLVLSGFFHRTRTGQHAAAASAAFAGYLAYAAYRHGVAESPAVFNVRCVATVSVLLACAMLAVRSAYWASTARIATLAGVIALVGAEIQSHYAGRDAHAALSIGWAALAGVLLAIGFARQHRTLRATGLGLLGLVAGKLVLVDLAGAPPLLRVISFVVIGTVMIAASYGYHRLTSRIARDATPADAPSSPSA